MGVYEFDPNRNGFDWREAWKMLRWVIGLSALPLALVLAYYFA